MAPAVNFALKFSKAADAGAIIGRLPAKVVGQPVNLIANHVFVTI